MKVVAYVLNADGTPLMPCYKHGRIRRWLKDGRVKIVNHKPFTVQLLEQIENPKTDRLLLGVDPGRENIGLCIINEEGKVLFASDVLTRNIAICKLVLLRKRARQASRRGDRKNRQRRACKAHPELKDGNLPHASWMQKGDPVQVGCKRRGKVQRQKKTYRGISLCVSKTSASDALKPCAKDM